MITFLEYIDKTDDSVNKKLTLLRKALEKKGYRVKDFINNDEDPHIFIFCLPKVSTFEGVRFYLLGDILAFRPQKKVDTEPYGKAYSFSIQDMYDDMILDYGDSDDEEKPIKKLLEKMADEMQRFFKKSKDAEEELIKIQLSDIDDKDSKADGIVVNTTGTDYASRIYSRGN